MGSDIFKAMIRRKIDTFIGLFVQDSNVLFKTDNRLFHPLEYGMYKEQAFKEILKFTVSGDLSISDGFIITSKNNVSTQCDLLVYRPKIPLIQENLAKFFPIESVSGIVEIKSNMNKKNFISALRKLAANKKLMDDRENTLTGVYNEERQHIFSVIVCNKFEFDYSQIHFEEIYEGIERKYWHNAILSINDGLFVYKLNLNNIQHMISDKTIKLKENHVVDYEYPIYKNSAGCYHPNIEFLKLNVQSPYQHIEYTLSIISNIIHLQVDETLEIISYLDYRANIFDD